ncbi:MAG: cytochrome c peroxidase [Burkholderiaceae bacterium]
MDEPELKPSAMAARPIPARIAAVALACLAALDGGRASAGQATDARGPGPAWSVSERAQILSHGPWPPPRSADPTNRYDGDDRARTAGRILFASRALSRGGALACIDCHQPRHGFTDGRPLATGLAAHHRNTLALHDLAGQRWFGWDGGTDSLWAASLRPLFNDIEMAVDTHRLRAHLRADERLRFLADEAPDATGATVNAAKAIAAWLAGLRSPRTPFDDYRDALDRGDREAMARYPAAAVRGLRLFIGRGRCTACHVGPRFTNEEFHDIGRPFFIGQGRVDAGRLPGVRRLRDDPFNLLGRYNDEPATGDGGRRRASWKTAMVITSRAQFGAWKTPTLRGLRHTAPYTHDGSLASLRAVVDHYSDFDPGRLHTHGEAILVPLRLSDDERNDLVAFLRSLSGPAFELP